jgi:hypothetical protein
MTVIEIAVSSHGVPDKFRVDVLASPAGEASAVSAIRVEDLHEQHAQLQEVVVASSACSLDFWREGEQRLRQVGQLLFKAVLGTGEVAGRYRASAAIAAERGQGLRVALRIADPALAGLPWEAMYDDTVGAYVCRRDQVVRQVGVASVAAPLAVSPPLRILGVISSPRDLPELDTEQERARLEQAISRLTAEGLAEITWAPTAEWADLQDVLQAGTWHVLHFIGHGGYAPGQEEGVLALTGEDGQADFVEASRLVDLLRQARPVPRLAVLSCCSGATAGITSLFSGTAAALVRGGMSAVAAMQYKISDPAAVAFTRGFYGAVARGRGIDDAVSSGRVAILGLSRQTLEWVTPVLYLRGHDSRLFTMATPRAAVPAHDH